MIRINFFLTQKKVFKKCHNQINEQSSRHEHIWVGQGYQGKPLLFTAANIIGLAAALESVTAMATLVDWLASVPATVTSSLAQGLCTVSAAQRYHCQLHHMTLCLIHMQENA